MTEETNIKKHKTKERKTNTSQHKTKHRRADSNLPKDRGWSPHTKGITTLYLVKKVGNAGKSSRNFPHFKACIKWKRREIYHSVLWWQHSWRTREQNHLGRPCGTAAAVAGQAWGPTSESVRVGSGAGWWRPCKAPFWRSLAGAWSLRWRASREDEKLSESEKVIEEKGMRKLMVGSPARP